MNGVDIWRELVVNMTEGENGKITMEDTGYSELPANLAVMLLFL